MIYLLDANILIRANKDYYPIERIPHFWRWLVNLGEIGAVKLTNEIFEEVIAGNCEVSTWLKATEVRSALRLVEEVNIDLLRRVVSDGYAPDLDSTELEKIGKDPFLIASSLASPDRVIVTCEVSKPSKLRANRKVPNICEQFGVRWINDFDFYKEADFRIA